MAITGIIGGSGLQNLDGMRILRTQAQSTPCGDPSAPLLHGEYGGAAVVFLARHGRGHTIPPHRINYRANLHALKQAGVTRVLAVAAVGGITAPMRPARLVIPSQIIDYTWGREHTYCNDGLTQVTHVDFTRPYCDRLRAVLIDAAVGAGLDAAAEAVYGATQGPRLESAAEIDRMERDGCDIVGMTGMPEAALARELHLPYACCAVVANWAAGRGGGEITMAGIEHHLAAGMIDVHTLLAAALPRLAAES